MIEVIPAIIAKNFSELEEKIRLVEPFASWVQLDVMDGKFVSNETYINSKEIKKLKSGLKIEAHLMVEDPVKLAEEWLSAGAKRVIVHWESLKGDKEKEFLKIKNKAELLKGQAGIALNPKTPWQKMEKLALKADVVLLMSVNPGFGGQKFLKGTLEKIKSLHKAYPKLKIEVDGGINLKTGGECVMAGAGVLIAGGYIFKSKNLKESFNRLSQINGKITSS